MKGFLMAAVLMMENPARAHLLMDREDGLLNVPEPIRGALLLGRELRNLSKCPDTYEKFRALSNSPRVGDAMAPEEIRIAIELALAPRSPLSEDAGLGCMAGCMAADWAAEVARDEAEEVADDIARDPPSALPASGRPF